MRKITSRSVGTALCALLLLATSRASRQDLEEAGALNTKVIELFNSGQYAEAIPLAQRALGPDHPDLASSLENLASRVPESPVPGILGTELRHAG